MSSEFFKRALVAAVLWAPGLVRADELKVGSNENQSVDCTTGTRVTVTGDHNQLVLQGFCESITVAGSDNQVSIESISGVLLTGSRNKVSYKSGIEQGAASGKPEVHDRGRGNEVTQTP